MRTLFVFSFFLLVGFSQVVRAQLVAQDAVFMSNNLSYSGIVVEQKPGEYIRLLRLPELDTLTFSMDSIDRLVKLVQPQTRTETTTSTTTTTTDPHKHFNQKPRFVMIHGYTGGGDYAFGGFGVSIAQRFKDRWQLGLGAHYIGQTGSYGDAFPDQQIVPLTIDYRWKFSQSANGRFATLLGVNAGYNFTLNKSYYDADQNIDVRISNGLFFNPNVAFRINVLDNTGLMLDIGYQLSTSGLYDRQTDKRIGGRQWHNFAARGTLFF